MEGQAVRPLLHRRPKGAQGLGDGGQPVALLQAQPGGVDKAALPRPHRRHGGQGGHQIGTLGHVQLHIPRPGQLPGIGDHPHIPLGGGPVQIQNLHLTAQQVGPIPKGGLGPVGLHRPVRPHIGLGAGESIAACRLLNRYAELVQRLEGHGHIVPALQRGGQGDGALPLHQGQGIQQSGDELAGHVPGQGVLPRR